MDATKSTVTSAVNPVKTTVTNVISAVSQALPATAVPNDVHATTSSPKPDETPLDTDQSKAKLERKLSLRPEKQELVEKNILKDTTVAPALQAKQAELKRAQIEDAVERGLQERIRQMSLYEEDANNAAIESQVLRSPDESSIDPIASAAALEKNLRNRPEKDILVERNILKDPKVAPGLQAAQEVLKRAQLEVTLEQKLQARPEPSRLVNEGILKEDEVPQSHA